MTGQSFDRRAPSGEREMGEFAARISALEDDVREMKGDLRKVLEFTQQARGSWKTLMAVSGASATVGAFVAKIVQFLPFKG